MKNQKLKKFFTLVLEPFAFGILALIFIIPTITVVNLEPITKVLKNLDVLGVSDEARVEINAIEGTHQIFGREKLLEDESGTFTYTTTLTRREADRYSKPILEIKNNKNIDVKLEIYGNTHLPTYSNISMIINDQSYKLQSPNGDVTTQNILLAPNQKYVVYLVVESFSNVQFNEDFELKIKEIE